MNRKALIFLFLNFHTFSHASFLDDPFDDTKQYPLSALGALFQKEGYLDSISTITVSFLSSVDQASFGAVSKDTCDVVNLCRLRSTTQHLMRIGESTPHCQKLFQEGVYWGWRARNQKNQESSTDFYHRQFFFLNALMEAAHHNVPLVPFLSTPNNTLVPLEELFPLSLTSQELDFKSVHGKHRYSSDLLKAQHTLHFKKFTQMFSLFSAHLRDVDMKHLICRQMDFLLRRPLQELAENLNEITQNEFLLFHASMGFETKRAVIKACLRSPVQDVLLRVTHMQQVMFSIFPRGLTDWEESAWCCAYVALTKEEFQARLQAFRDFGSAFFSKSSMFLERKIINQQDRASILTLCLDLPPEKTELLSHNASVFFPHKTHSIHDRPSLLRALSGLSEKQIMTLVTHALNFSFLAINAQDLIDFLEELQCLSVRQLDAVGGYAHVFFPAQMNLVSRLNRVKFLKNFTPTQLIRLGEKESVNAKNTFRQSTFQ